MTSQYVTHYFSSSTAASGNQLFPSPLISITPEYYYANDMVVGYTYNVNLKGYATSIDTRDQTVKPHGFSDVLQSIKTIKNIFNSNDGILLVQKGSGDPPNFEPVIQASGGTVRNLQFSESDNLWVNYSQYSVDLEFNDVQLTWCTGDQLQSSVAGTQLDSSLPVIIIPSGITYSQDFVDMRKYQIRSFNDSWNFDLSDNIYNRYDINTNNINSRFYNEYVTATYTVSAVGKHYYAPGQSGNRLVLASWEQAKNFVQNKIYNQILVLNSGLYNIQNSNQPCSYTFIDTFSQFKKDEPPFFLEGFFDAPQTPLNLKSFGIYNETVSYETSESEGSFSATYKCLIKRINPLQNNLSLSDNDAIHTFSISEEISDTDRKNVTITVDGNIQGLIPTGFVYGSGVFVFGPYSNPPLPQTDDFLISAFAEQGEYAKISNLTNTGKYDYALKAFERVGSQSGLKPSFVNILGITFSGLGVDLSNCSYEGPPPHASHSVSHNYNEGSISYRTSFTTDRACAVNSAVRNIRVVVEDPVPVIQEFVVPGRSGGPIVQIIGPMKPKTITINTDGIIPMDTGLYCPTDLAAIASGYCLIATINDADIDGLKLKSHQASYAKDGSYSVSRSYLYCDPP